MNDENLADGIWLCERLAPAHPGIAALLAEYRRLRVALEAVEYPEEEYCCPWCHSPAYDLEHRADCQRQLALGLTP